MWTAHFLRSLLTRFSLRTSLLLLLSGVVAVLVADRAREILGERHAAILEAQSDILELARRGAQRHADLIANARAVLQLATGLPETSGSSATACQVPFRRIAQDLPWLTSITVIDVQGRPVCTNAERLMSISVADRPYFQGALATGGFVLSDYIISRLTQKPIIVAAMPRLVSGEPQSVVIASIDVDESSVRLSDACHRQPWDGHRGVSGPAKMGG